MRLNNQWPTEESKEEMEKKQRQLKQKHDDSKPMGCS